MPCGPVNSIAEIFEDPQYKARENIKLFKDPRVGEIAMPNVCPRLSDTPGSVEWLGPELGRAQRRGLQGACSACRIAEIGVLQDKGVI